MSAASQVAFKGVSAARAMFATLAAALRSAGPEVTRETAEAARGLMAGIATSQLGRHRLSGHALDVAGDGEISGSRVRVKFPRYVTYHRWFSLRGGLPPFVLKQIAVIYARKLLAHLGAAGYDGAAEATALVAAADASASAKATKKAEAAARANVRRAERKAATAAKRAAAKAARAQERAAKRAAKGAARG